MEIPDICKSTKRDPRIVLQEKRSKITFINASREDVVVVTVDGCAITNSIRCDYLVIDKLSKEYYIELKGSDVKHAVSQIEQTIAALSKDKQRQEKHCFIISTRCPLISTEIQELKVKFKNQYKSTLVIQNTPYQHTL